MRNQFHKRILLASGITLGMMLISPITHAADWTGTEGGTGSWGLFNTTAPISGWNDPAGYPNIAGAVAQLIGPVTVSSPITTQDTGAPVTVGTINYGNNNDLGNFYWQITNTNGITLDQDGAGAGFAKISNSSTTAGGNNALYITTGTLTLADDLHVINTTTASTNNNGAIQIDTALAGTGNVTLSSSQAIDSLMSNTRAQGSIRFTQAGTAYVGTIAIEKGLVVVAATNAFGTVATNMITLGSVGANDAALVSQSSTAFATPIIPNDIVLASGNTGVLTVGTLNTNASGVTAFNGAVNLNGNNLNVINAAAAGAMNFNGQITGAGGVTKTGPGIVSFNPTKPAAGTNDYTGDTVVSAGNLSVFTGGAFGLNAIPDGPGKGNVIVNAGAILAVSGVETINGLSGDGFVQNTTNNAAHTFDIGANNVTSTFSGVMRNTATNRILTISKTGTGTLTLSGANTYSGTTTVNAGTLQFAKQVSLYNNQVNGVNAGGSAQTLTGTWIATNIRVNAGATAAFNVGGTNEFTEANIAVLQALGTAATNSGFGNGSSIGFDTTNAAGGEFVYNIPVANTFAGANSIGLTKLGSNTLTLAAVNTYTGNTTVSGGTLNITGNHTTGANYSVASGASLNTKNVRVTNGLTVNGTTTITANGGTAGASKVETLTIGAGGKLNLKDNDLVVGTAPNFNAVRTAIIAGKTNNAATGITSDITGFGVSRGFAYAMGNDAKLSSLLAGSLSGQSYDADSVLVKFTLLGDADLDGDTDLNDLGLWSNGYTGDLGVTTSPTTFWTGGDFDYDGDTDLNDLGLWSSTYTGDFNGGPGSLVVNAPDASPEAVAILNSMGFTVVPEPSTFVLAGVGLAGLAIAARRRKK